MIERSTVYCTNCGGSFIQELDMSLDGNHQITCPLCQHIHYRVVQKGVVTEERWASSGGTYYVANTFVTFAGTTATTSSTLTTSLTFLSSSWFNRSDLA